MKNVNTQTEIVDYMKTSILGNNDLRIGQLLVNAAQLGGWGEYDIFYCPDEIIKNGLSIMVHDKTIDKFEPMITFEELLEEVYDE